jgi:hypothetical protein
MSRSPFLTTITALTSFLNMPLPPFVRKTPAPKSAHRYLRATKEGCIQKKW